MYLYSSSVPDFVKLAKDNDIASNLEEKYRIKLSEAPNPSEVKSWNNSLEALADILADAKFDAILKTE